MSDADVSQVAAGSEVVDPSAGVAITDPPTDLDSTNTGATSEPDFDFAGLQKQMADLGESAATKAELDSIKRAAGHIPGVMSKLDALEKRLEGGITDPRVDAILERLNLLIDGASPLLPEETTSKLRAPEKPLTAEDVDKQVSDRLAAIAAEEDAKRGAPQELDPETQRAVTIADAQWAAAATAIGEYATKIGIDIGLLKPEDFQQVQLSTFSSTHPFGDPIAGATALMKKLDELKAAEGRRSERADASKGKLPAGTQSGTLTLAAMDAMTDKQLMNIPRAERDAALRAGV